MDRSHDDKRSRRELLNEIAALRAEVLMLRGIPSTSPNDGTSAEANAREQDYASDRAPIEQTGQIVDLASVLGAQRDRSDLPQARYDLRLDMYARRQFEFTRSIMGAMVEGVVVLDHQGLLSQINPAAQAMLGFKFGELLGRNFHDFCHYRHADGTAFPVEDCPIQRATRTGETIRGAEDYFLRADKTFLPVQYSCSPVITDNQVTGTVLTFQDITERNKLQQELLESERTAVARVKQFDAIFEAIADGVILYDQWGNILRSNAAARQMVGLDSASDAFTRPLAERLELFAIADAAGNPIRNPHLPFSEYEQQEVLRGLPVDYSARALDGRHLWLSVSGAPFYDTEGKINGAICILRDVTRRRQLEQQIIEESDQREAILEALGDAILVYDANGNIVRLNEAAHQMLGLESVDDYFSLPAGDRTKLLRLRHEDGTPFTREEWPHLRLLRGETLTSANTSYVIGRNFKGHDLISSYSGRPIRDQEGHITGAVLSFHEVTKQFQRERQHQALITMLMQLVATLMKEQEQGYQTTNSYDARSIGRLVVRTASAIYGQLAGAVQALADLRKVQLRSMASGGVTPRDKVATTSLVRRMDEQVTRLNRIVELLLDTTHLALGDLALTLAPCDLLALLSETMSSERRTHPFHTISTDLQQTRQPIMSLVDAACIKQALRYLFADTFVHTSSDAPIAVRLRLAGAAQQAQIIIQSKRQQFDERALAQRFAALQAHETAFDEEAAETAGLDTAFGFGLAIARALIELHGGSAGFEHGPESDNVTLCVALPLLGDR